jgi:putative ABC transport system permease protein
VLSPVLLSSLRVGFETLRANPLRTLLSTLGIIMGVGALVSVLALGDGVEHYARRQIESTTDLQAISIAPQASRRVEGVSVPNTDVPRFTLEHADDLSRTLGVGNEVALVSVGASLAHTRADTTSRGAVVAAVTSNAPAIRALRVERGRFFTDAEARSGAPVVVLSRGVANALAAPSRPDAGRGRGLPAPAGPLTAGAAALIGDTVYFQDRPRVVVGIIAADEEDRSRLAFVPIGASSASSGSRSGLATIVVKVGRVEQSSAIRETVERWLTQRFGAWKDRVEVSTNRARVEQVEQGMLIFKLLMGALTGVSLLVGGSGIINVLLAWVIERTREIGIRKAAGAQQRHILVQFLCESVTISAAGSVLGVALGLATSFAVTAVMRARTNAPVYAWVSVSTIGIAVLASVVVGLAFGLYPALRAARLVPIEAIHRE